MFSYCKAKRRKEKWNFLSRNIRSCTGKRLKCQGFCFPFLLPPNFNHIYLEMCAYVIPTVYSNYCKVVKAIGVDIHSWGHMWPNPVHVQIKWLLRVNGSDLWRSERLSRWIGWIGWHLWYEFRFHLCKMVLIKYSYTSVKWGISTSGTV
jgi:hypothetical protein